MLQVIELGLMIALPCLVSIGIVHFAFARIKLKAAKQEPAEKAFSIYKIYPEEGLADQGLLWLSICAPTLYFFTFGWYAWSGHSIQINASGFESFVKISALPLGLLSLTIPLTLLVVRIHSTTQTATQIKITKLKNNLDGYYTHRKAMFDYFSVIEEIEYEGKIKGKFSLHPRLHLKFFEKTPPEKGIPNVDKVQIQAMLATLNEIRESLATAMNIATSRDMRLVNYLNASTKIYKLATLLALEEIYKNLKTKSHAYRVIENGDSFEPSNPYYLYTAGVEQDHIFGAFRYCRSYARLICEFCGEPTTTFDEMKFIDIDKGDSYKLPKYYQLRNMLPSDTAPKRLPIEKTQNLILWR